MLELVFVTGFRPQIKAGVKLMGAKGLQKVMDVAILVEDWSKDGEPEEETTEPVPKVGRAPNGRFQAQQGKQAQTGSNQNKTRPNQTTTTSSNSTGMKPNHNRLKPPFRRLTPAEVAKWKAEGLCFKCDEKYVYPHKCAQAELVVLMVLEDGTELDVSNCSMELEETEDSKKVEVAEISISSIMGISSSRTIKLRGTLQRKEVVVLIDSGATHNFVSSALVEQLKLEPDQTRGYSVLTAGGVTFKGAGMCSNLELELQGCTITSSFLPLELGSADVILGIQWLEKLGNVKVNWKLQVLRFKIGAHKYVLQGDPSLCCSPVSLKSMMKTLQNDGEVMRVEYNGMVLKEDATAPTAAVPQCLQNILEEYKEVFAEPSGLPISRGKEHAITLKQDASPVSIRPFPSSTARRD